MTSLNRALLAASLLLVSCGKAGDGSFEKLPIPEPLPFEAASPTAAPDPSRPGPYPVGVRTVVFEDSRRLKPDGTPRRLVTEIWYPAVEAARGQPGTSYDMLPLMTDAQRAKLVGLDVPKLQTAAVRDAAPRKDRGQFPFVIFSHGQGGIRWQSTYYTVVLASHGYIVVSPDHEGNTVEDALHDHLSQPTDGFENRPLDVSYLIDRFGRLPDDEPLKGLADLKHIGVTGHSFGGFTSLRAAAIDKRIKAIVPQAPPSAEIDWLGLPTPVLLGIPVLVEAGHADQTLPWDEHIAPTWPLLQKPRYLLDVSKGGHFTFSDLCGFNLSQISERLDLGLTKVLSDGCAAPAPTAAVAQPLINFFAIGFFNGVLRESPGSLKLLSQASANQLGEGVAVFTADP